MGMIGSKLIRGALLAACTVLVFTGSASAQDAKIGNRATVKLEGEVGKQVALALGNFATAHNGVGGITAGNGVSIGNQATVSAHGKADDQVALALGNGASASNNVGGIVVMGSLTSR
jgi:hypothetical protein